MGKKWADLIVLGQHGGTVWDERLHRVEELKGKQAETEPCGASTSTTTTTTTTTTLSS